MSRAEEASQVSINREKSAKIIIALESFSRSKETRRAWLSGGSIFFCVFIFLCIFETQIFGKILFNSDSRVVLSLESVDSVKPNAKLILKMETRSRTTKLIVKNVEMLESSKFDKFDKVSQWLDKLDTFEYHQHQKNPHIAVAANPQNSSSRVSQDKNDDFFDSDSSVNTGMAP